MNCHTSTNVLSREAAKVLGTEAPEPEPAPKTEVEVAERADSGAKHKTTLPRIAGGYKLPSSSLLG